MIGSANGGFRGADIREKSGMGWRFNVCNGRVRGGCHRFRAHDLLMFQEKSRVSADSSTWWLTILPRPSYLVTSSTRMVQQPSGGFGRGDLRLRWCLWCVRKDAKGSTIPKMIWSNPGFDGLLNLTLGPRRKAKKWRKNQADSADSSSLTKARISCKKLLSGRNG